MNVQAAQEALPEIINIMAEELGWSEDEKKVYYTCTICRKYVLLFIIYTTCFIWNTNIFLINKYIIGLNLNREEN